MYDKTWMMRKYDAVMAHHIKHHVKGLIYLPHWHPLMEIMIVEEGSVRVRVKDESYDLKKGDSLIINPGEVHMAENLTGKVAYHCFQIDLFMLSDNRTDIQQKFLRNMMLEEKHFLKAQIDSKHFNMFLTHMIFLDDHDELADSMRKLLVYLLRTERNMLGDEAKKSFVMYKHSLSQIKPTVSYMRENFFEKISLDELSSIANLSSIHYSRVFKQVMYFTPIEFLNLVRNQNAVELLLETTMTIAEIAVQIGMNDTNYFSRFFKHYSGFTPTQFRKRYKVKTY